MRVTPKISDLQSIHGSWRSSQYIPRMRSYLEQSSTLMKSKISTHKLNGTLDTVTREPVSRRTMIRSPSCAWSASAYCWFPTRKWRRTYLIDGPESIKIGHVFSKPLTTGDATNKPILCSLIVVLPMNICPYSLGLSRNHFYLLKVVQNIVFSQ